MTAPAITPASALLKPADPFEWALALVLWPMALAAPVALLVFMWPGIVEAGGLGVFVFCLTLALGFVISACVLWLFAPLAVVAAALVGGLFCALRGIWRMCMR